jgi:flagellar protein FliO/FliZ
MIMIQSRFKNFAILLCFSILFLFGTPHMYAAFDENTNVKECIENPDKCSKEEQPAAETNSEKAAVSVSAWDYVKMVLALLFVVALLYGVLKLVNSRNRLYQQHQLMQNLGGLSLGQHKSVQLLQVGDSLFLVGVGEDISILKELTDIEEKEKLMKFYSEKQEFTPQIPYIAELLKRFKKPSSIETSVKQENGKFEQLFRKRLGEIKTDRSDSLRDWKNKENDRQ